MWASLKQQQMDSEPREVAVEQENTGIFGVSGVGRTAKLHSGFTSNWEHGCECRNPRLSLPSSAQNDLSSLSNTTAALMDLTALLCLSVADHQTQYKS